MNETKPKEEYLAPMVVMCEFRVEMGFQESTGVARVDLFEGEEVGCAGSVKYTNNYDI